MRLPRQSTLFAISVAIVGIAAALWWQTRSVAAADPADIRSVKIALPVQLAAGGLFVAEEQKLFAQQALKVELQRFLLGKQALEAVLKGSSDLALVADTPFMHAVLRGERIAALATVFESRTAMAIVGRRDAGITDAASLAGKKVGTVSGTNAEFFLDTLLDVNGIVRNQVTVDGLQPGQLVAALEERKVDAVTVWHPNLARLEQELGTKAVYLYGGDMFVYRFLLVGKQDYISAHQAELQHLLRAIKATNAYIHEQPAAARNTIGLVIGIPAAQLERAFDPADFRLVLDQSLLIALSAQGRWAAAKNNRPGALPDFLDFISAQALHAVAPDADRIIR